VFYVNAFASSRAPAGRQLHVWTAERPQHASLIAAAIRAKRGGDPRETRRRPV
jgi:hypothetical protein